MKKLLVVSLLAAAFSFSGCGSDKSTQVPMLADDAPPLTPTGLTCQVGNSLIPVLTWTPNTEADLAGYRVYIYDPDPRRNGSYVLQNPDGLLTEARWTSSPIQYDQVLWVRLTAVDAGGNESASEPKRATWEPPASPPPALPPAPKPPQIVVEEPGGSGNGTGGGIPTPPTSGSGPSHGEATDGSDTER